MPPPTPLSIATSSVTRLVKEEASYHRELESQQKRVEKLEAEIAEGKPDEDGNREYVLKQEVRSSFSVYSGWGGEMGRWGDAVMGADVMQKQALEETRNVLPSLKKKIAEAVEKLDKLLVCIVFTFWSMMR